MRPDPKLIDPGHRHTIDLYVRHAVPPGSGILAFLENNLREAVLRCDEPTLYNLIHIVAYLQWEVPAECWGSVAKVRAWRGTQPDTVSP